MVLVGDVRGKRAVLVDDMADTCGTLVKAAEVLEENGATETMAIVTHAILSGNAIHNLNNSRLSRLVVTNTVPLSQAQSACSILEEINVAPVVGLLFCFIGR